MRHANVRNADEVEVREMIKGRHNMRLRQLRKPADSIALGATLTEVAPGGISFPPPRPLRQRRSDLCPLRFRRGADRRCTGSCSAGRLDCVADRSRARASDGQRLDRRTARLSLYLDDAGAEIVEYPDSGKVGAGVADPTSPVGFRIGMFRAGSGTLDYWESEPEAG